MGPWGILLMVGVVVLADRITKVLAVRGLPRGRRVGGVLRVVINDRLPFAANASSRWLIGLWLAAVLCAAGLIAVSPSVRATPLVGIGIGAALAGAASNLRDCLASGSVVDFIAIGWWPVFNLADAAIVMGGTVAVLALI